MSDGAEGSSRDPPPWLDADEARTPDAEAAGLLSAQHRRLSVAVYTTIALIAFEGTSVAAALPELAADLGDVGRLPWVITGFLFALGLTTVIAGPLVDALGARALFAPSALAFAGAGCAAGFSTDIDVLIAIRVFQGGASGVLFAATIAAVNLGFPAHLTGRAFAANSTIWGVMGAAAPALAAVLLNVASWRWIFFVNLPLGLIAVAAGRGVMPERQEGAEAPGIDWQGAFLAAVFTLCSIAAVDRLGPSSAVFAVLAIAVVAVYVRHARRSERPIVELRHIAVQPYSSLALVTSLMLTAAFTANIYVTVYVAAGRGVSAGAAAWSVLFFTIGWTLGANVSTFALDRTSAVNVMSAGLGFGIVGLVIAAAGVGADAPLPVLFAGLSLLGVGIGLATNSSLIGLRSATPPAQIGRASAAHQFARSQGFTIGAAAGGSILLFIVDRRLGSVDPIRRLLAGEEIDAGPAAASAVRDGFTAVTVTGLIIMLLAVPVMHALRRHDVESGGADATVR